MPPLKIATWNVNGIRAREAQFLEWVERERPDVVCLQEIKSPVSKVPVSICELQGYRCYWHGERAYSGVGLHIRREAFAEPTRAAVAAASPKSRVSFTLTLTMKRASLPRLWEI